MNDYQGESSVFVIIVTYNGMRFYDNLFKSLLPITTKGCSVIVVDNCSTDGTVEYICENFPFVKVIPNNENSGFGRANNLGIRIALDMGADYVFLLNQDTTIHPDTINNLVRIHKENSTYGILSPMHLAITNQGIERNCLLYVDNSQITDSQLFEDMYFGRMGSLYETSFINAAAWLIPRAVLETVGGFDPMFYHYGEDDNYVQRVKYHGFKIGICPQATICHDSGNRISGAKGAFTEFRQLKVKILNINTNYRPITEILVCVKHSLQALIRFDIGTFNFNTRAICFLIQSNRKIHVSRAENMKKQPSWLI